MGKVSDYRVTDRYGATYSPWTKAAPHTGDDWACPAETDIDVGDTIIGNVGKTGKASGYHTHIQKYKNGYLDPNHQGLANTIAFPARVSEVGYRDDIGNFLRLIDADGFRWSYFHQIRAPRVGVGHIINAKQATQTTQGGTNVATIQDSDNWKFRASKTMRLIQGRDLAAGELKPWVGGDFLHLVEAIEDAPAAEQHFNDSKLGVQARSENWQGQIQAAAQAKYDLQKTIDELNKTVTDLRADDDADKTKLNEALAKIQELTKRLEATNNVPNNNPEISKESVNWIVKLLTFFVKK